MNTLDATTPKINMNVSVGDVRAVAFTTPPAPYLQSIAVSGQPGEGPFAALAWLSKEPGGEALGPVKSFSQTGSNRLKFGSTPQLPRSVTLFGKQFNLPGEQYPALAPNELFYINVFPLSADDGVASVFVERT